MSTQTEPLLTMVSLQKTMLSFREKHGPPLAAIKISEATVYEFERMFPVYPSQGKANTLYSVPIQIDNELELFECVPVYA